jgi:hypothetical protein
MRMALPSALGFLARYVEFFAAILGFLYEI